MSIMIEAETETGKEKIGQKNLFLIYPTMVGEAPINLGFLSKVAKEEGWNVTICVNTFKKSLEVADFVNQAKAFNTKVAGISMLTFEVLKTYEIIKALKKEGITVIVGGPHPTDKSEECIEHGADVVVVGEGEEVLRDILREYPNIKPGIRGRKPFVDLSNSTPDLDSFNKDLFKGDDGLIRGFHRVYTSRACPVSCTFCDDQVFGRRWREVPVPTIIGDIKRRVENYDITSIGIADDCFTVDRKRAMQFCDEVVRINPQITWRVNSRANLVNEELLRAFKQAGCYSIAFGLESGDRETLKRIKKGVTLEQNIAACKMAHEAGLVVYGCLMTGFPWEKPENVQNQIDFIHEIWNDVSLFQVSGSLVPFPGTNIYHEFAKEYGFEGYWLKPEHQKHGIQIYQNASNPLAVSTFYQRYFFDDTYIQKDTFFQYSEEYKQMVKKLVMEIGRHNVRFMFPNKPLTQRLISEAARLSMRGSEIFPGLEEKVGGFLFEAFHKSGPRRSSIENLRDQRRGIVKHIK